LCVHFKEHAWLKPIYNAEASVTGGRVHGHGKTIDGELGGSSPPARPPRAGHKANPERSSLSCYAACFEGAIRRCGGGQVRRGDVLIDSKVVADGGRGPHVS